MDVEFEFVGFSVEDLHTVVLFAEEASDEAFELCAFCFFFLFFSQFLYIERGQIFLH